MEIRSVSSISKPPAPDERSTGIRPPGAAGSKSLAAVAPTEDEKKAQPSPHEEQVSEALKSINSTLQARAQELEFSVDSDSDRTVVKVIDKDTKEVIRQMPSEEALEIAKALDRMQSLLIRQTA